MARKANDSGQFLNEEHLRGRLGNGSHVMPEPSFVQPKGGAQTVTGESITFDTKLKGKRVKQGNDEEVHDY